MTKSSNPNPIKIIEVGKFYFVHDGSKTGHPCYVISKDDKKNEYLVVKFDSDKHGDIPKKDRGVRHITKMSHPISTEVRTSYVKNRPLLCRRKDFVSTELKNMFISEEDVTLIKKVSARNPILSRSIKKNKK